MTAKTDVWMPIYVGDYLADTQHLSLEQHGAYFLLLIHYWRVGPLPDDDVYLARVAKATLRTWKARVAPTIRLFFSARDGRLHQKRADAEREMAARGEARKRELGVAGAQQKWRPNPAHRVRSDRLAAARKIARHTSAEWSDLLAFCGCCVRCQARDVTLVKDHIRPIYKGGSDGIGNLQPLCIRCNASKGSEETDHRPNGWQNASERLQNACRTPGLRARDSQSPSQSPKKSPSDSPARVARARDGEPDEFAAFYASYPRRVGRPSALAAWKSALKRGILPDDVLTGLQAHRFSEDPKFIPHPSRWLNDERWKDDPSAAVPGGRRETAAEERRRKLGIISPLEFRQRQRSPANGHIAPPVGGSEEPRMFDVQLEQRIRSWLDQLAALYRAGAEPVSADEVDVIGRMLLQDGLPAGAFCSRSMHHVTEAVPGGYFPAYGEIRSALRGWWTAHRPALAPALDLAEGDGLTAEQQSWLAFWHTRRSEILAEGYRPRRGSVDADLKNLASCIRTHGRGVWPMIAGDGRTSRAPPTDDEIAEVAAVVAEATRGVGAETVRRPREDTRVVNSSVSPETLADIRRQRGVTPVAPPENLD